MKLNQIKEIIDVILNIPLEDYINENTAKLNGSTFYWDSYKRFYKEDDNSPTYCIRICVDENLCTTISFKSLDLYEQLCERKNEIREYIDNKLYNFITNK